MKKIKLGILNSSPLENSYGGTSPFMKNLNPFLKQPFDVSYITLPPFLHDLKFFPRRLTLTLFLILKIRSLKRYDVILSHVPEGSYIVSFTNTPLIHIFHGNFNAMSQSRFWYGKYFRVIFNLFEKRILKKAKLTYTVGKERPQVSKILNPIYHFVPIVPQKTRAGFIFIGRLEKIKNIDLIIKAYSLLDIGIINENPLYIVGDGSQEQFLKQIVTDLNLLEKVLFTGNITNDMAIEEISKKRILLMASSQEGLPMAIAESLSVGVPVISTDTGDISRVIKDGYNGFLLPIDFDLNTYVAKIKEVLNNYQGFAANALKSSEIFKAESIAKGLINDIQKVFELN